MESIDPKLVGQRIEWIRQQLGLTQMELARSLQISQAAISKYLNHRLPPAEVLYRLAILGNTTVEWILTGKKNYWFNTQANKVKEEESYYDADLSLARKISHLPLEVRQALITLIDFLIRD